MADNGASSVLVVCTANRCRSPLAAAALDARARAAGLAWTVHSAGVRARTGEVTEPAALAALGEAGLPAAAAPVRRLDVATAVASDLVLTAERAHRSRVLDLAPALVGRVFTLLELDRLLAAVPDGPHPARTVTEVAAIAESARWRAGAGGAEDDLPDPLGGPLSAFRACLAVTDRVAARLVAACRAAP